MVGNISADSYFRNNISDTSNQKNMRLPKIKLIQTLCAIMIVLFAGNALVLASSLSDPLLPEGLGMEDIFKPGTGLPVGHVLSVQGEAVIMHEERQHGYRAKDRLPLFQGDTIVTREKSHLWVKLNDESIITIDSKTKLILTLSFYDPNKKIRFSFLDMCSGMARFWVNKMSNFKPIGFKVRTPTSVTGVRASDFLIRATPKITEVITFQKTTLEVVSLAIPGAKPMILKSFERTTVRENALPAQPESLPPEEAEKLMREFTITPEEAKPEIEQKEREKETITKEDLRRGGEEGPDIEQGTAGDGTAEEIASHGNPSGVTIAEEDSGQTGPPEKAPLEDIAKRRESKSFRESARKDPQNKSTGSFWKKPVFVAIIPVLIAGACILFAFRMRSQKQERPEKQPKDGPSLPDESQFIEAIATARKTLLEAAEKGDKDEMRRIVKDTFKFIKSTKRIVNADKDLRNDEYLIETIRIFEERWEGLVQQLIETSETIEEA